MRNFNENTITDAVLDRITDAGQPRIRQISEALVRHLHAFVREIRPTQREWEQGIEFLTRTGHMCDDKRQEFILLSDTLGVSMLVDAINHGAEKGVTDTTVLGPFFVQAAPEKKLGEDISGGMEGDPMIVTGSVSGRSSEGTRNPKRRAYRSCAPISRSTDRSKLPSSEIGSANAPASSSVTNPCSSDRRLRTKSMPSVSLSCQGSATRSMTRTARVLAVGWDPRIFF